MWAQRHAAPNADDNDNDKENDEQSTSSWEEDNETEWNDHAWGDCVNDNFHPFFPEPYRRRNKGGSKCNHGNPSQISIHGAGDKSTAEMTGFITQSPLEKAHHVGDGRSDKVLSKEALLGRCVLLLDVNCFYCQCVEVDDPVNCPPTKPIAVGQKYLVVTSNYEARRRGVRKLMSKKEAKELCPDLLIVDGSDLEQFRRYSRSIYQSFRTAVKDLKGGRQNAVARGGMDEMYADITATVNAVLAEEESAPLKKGDEDEIFVYGDHDGGGPISITEDQSGATSTVVVRPRTTPSSSPQWGGMFTLEESELIRYQRRLCIAARMAQRVRSFVLRETKFQTSGGVSISPMLAKLAADLKKPNSTNVLYPWRSHEIMDSMPLRNVPDLGSRTIRLLRPLLMQHAAPKFNKNDNPNSRRYTSKPSEAPRPWWTCRDLVQIPPNAVLETLSTEITPLTSCERYVELILNRCRGIDTVPVKDDNGGLTKTVSVEDSFQRGNLTTEFRARQELEKLFVRLPRLLDDRRSYSSNPEMAYPSVIRLTVRTVDPTQKDVRRRPFITHSRQCAFADGKTLLRLEDEDRRARILRTAVAPLADALIFRRRSSSWSLDITRMNLAVSNFGDLNTKDQTPDSELDSQPLRRYWQVQATASQTTLETDFWMEKEFLEKDGLNDDGDVAPTPTPPESNAIDQQKPQALPRLPSSSSPSASSSSLSSPTTAMTTTTTTSTMTSLPGRQAPSLSHKASGRGRANVSALARKRNSPTKKTLPVGKVQRIDSFFPKKNG